jgi:hypothetical protein
MSRLWTKVRRERKRRRDLKPPKLTLEFQLCEIISARMSERGFDEGPVDALCRIIRERDCAMTLLALDRIKGMPL